MKTIEELEAELETVKRERDEARETIVALTTAKAEADLEIAAITAALDERDLEAERGLEQYDLLVHQLADATNEATRVRLESKREVEALTDERDELLVRVANQDAELRATRESYNEARAEVAHDIRLACLDARRNEREMIATWLAEEMYRLPVYQPSYGPKELRARARALEGAACAVRSCAHVPRVEDDDD